MEPAHDGRCCHPANETTVSAFTTFAVFWHQIQISKIKRRTSNMTFSGYTDLECGYRWSLLLHQSSLSAGHLALMRVCLKSANMVPISSAAVVCTLEYWPWRRCRFLQLSKYQLITNAHSLHVSGKVQTWVYANNGAPHSKCHGALCRWVWKQNK